MASNDDKIKALLGRIKADKSSFDTGWLENWLHGLSDKQLDAAIQAAGDKAGAGEFNELVNASVDAAEQAHKQEDPASRIKGKDMHGLPLIGGYSAASDPGKLRDYFNSDPFLKGNIDAQNKLVDALLSGGAVNDVVARAKELNQQQRTPDELFKDYGWRYKEGDLTDFLNQRNAEHEGLKLGDLKKKISGFTPYQQWRTWLDIQKQLGNNRYIRQSDIDKLTDAVQPTKDADPTKAATAAVPVSPLSPTEQAQSDALSAPNSAGVEGGPGLGHVVAPESLISAYTGQNPDQLQKDYQAMVESFQQAQQRKLAQAGSRPTGPQPQPPTYDQYLNRRQYSAEQSFSPILNYYEAAWQQAHYAPMPDNVRAQLLNRINSTLTDPRTKDLADQLRREAESYQGAVAGGDKGAQATAYSDLAKGLSTSALQKDWDAASNAATEASGANLRAGEEKQLREEWYSKFGQEIPEQDLSKMSPMDMKGYLNAFADTHELWQRNYGRDPNLDEIKMAMGKSQEDLQRYINDSPSRVSGVSLGQYNDISDWGDKLSKQYWGRPVDDQMVSLIAKEIQ